MFNAAMETFAEAAEKSLHAEIKSKVSEFKSTIKGHSDKYKLKTTEKPIVNLECNLTATTKVYMLNEILLRSGNICN